MFKSKTKIMGFGAAVPEKVMTNADFEKIVDTNNEWIVQRTGINSRHIAREDEFSSDLAIRAVEDLIEKNSADVSNVDMIIVTTLTPDHYTPTLSAMVQAHFGMRNAGTMDLWAGCTGFCYGMYVADALITSGRNKKILVISAETLSKITDYTDRSTCILFGDAASACLLEYTDGEGAFLGGYFDTDGDMGENVTCGNFSDTINGLKLEKNRIFDQNGRQVYKYLLQHVPKGIGNLLESAGIELNDINWFVPHSANLRMLQALCEKMKLTSEKMLTSVEDFGNTSSASIPLAITLADRQDKLKKDDKMILYGFGGGLTHGGVIIKL